MQPKAVRKYLEFDFLICVCISYSVWSDLCKYWNDFCFVQILIKKILFVALQRVQSIFCSANLQKIANIFCFIPLHRRSLRSNSSSLLILSQFFFIFILLSFLCLSQYLETPFSSEWIHFLVICWRLTTHLQSKYEPKISWFWTCFQKKSYYNGNVDSIFILRDCFVFGKTEFHNTIVHFLYKTSLSTTLISFFILIVIGNDWTALEAFFLCVRISLAACVCMYIDLFFYNHRLQNEWVHLMSWQLSCCFPCNIKVIK